MMQIIRRDITDVESGVIIHVCNNRGVMGAGVAKALYTKWPKVKKNYELFCNSGVGKSSLLGRVAFARVSNSLVVANMIAQDGYGRDGKEYLNYTALCSCLTTVNRLTDEDTKIYLPYKMGCGLAGGDWDKVQGYLDKYLANPKFVEDTYLYGSTEREVYICKKED